jgi:hypothetical protein
VIFQDVSPLIVDFLNEHILDPDVEAEPVEPFLPYLADEPV